MPSHPITNALSAVAYIALVSLLLRFIESIRHDTPDTFIDGMGFLSLFTLSAAVMAFLFFYQPARLLIEKKPSEAAGFFFKTIGAFALITISILTIASMQ